MNSTLLVGNYFKPLLQQESPLLLLAAVAVLVVIITSWMSLGSKKKDTNVPPEAPGAWPLIGHLPLLVGRELPHHVFSHLADKLGPVFSIRTGVNRSIVVNSWELAKECYTTNDRFYSSRPPSSAAEIIGFDYVSFGFAPYGPYWRTMRKIMMTELLSNSRITALKHVKDSEIERSMKDLYKICINEDPNGGPVLVEMKKWFGDLTLNVMLMMIVGRKYSGDEDSSKRFRLGMRSFMILMGIFVPGDAFPFLRWLDLGGHRKKMRNTIKELDSLFQTWYEDHKIKRANGEAKGDEDFMHVLMTICEQEKISEYDNDTVIISTCLSLFSGSDTTMLTLTWILALLVNNKSVLKKAQEEIDGHVGRDRNVNDSDVKNLVYVQALIKESLRMYPAGPLASPRFSIEDSTLGGYHIPAGTNIVLNLFKIQRDPKVWSDPAVYRPERFLEPAHADLDVKGQNYELLPFGSGRRGCPGINLAIQLMPLAVARLIHGFDIEARDDTIVDMTESAGLTNVKATPLPLLITPRLRAELY